MYHRRVLPSVGISDELRENFLEKIRHGHFHFSSADPQSVAFLEKYAEPVAVFDRDLKHVLVNSAVALATDIPAQQFRGKTLREMGHREDICEQIELNVKTVFMTGDEDDHPHLRRPEWLDYLRLQAGSSILGESGRMCRPDGARHL